jgi:ABC-type Fe3+/spermidine/putrescine transport system ATPase subunit
MVRPEKIVMSFNGAENWLSATIEAAVYLGESTHWKIKLSDGQAMTVLEQNREASRPTQDRVGNQVRVSWATESAVILR